MLPRREQGRGRSRLRLWRGRTAQRFRLSLCRASMQLLRSQRRPHLFGLGGQHHCLIHLDPRARQAVLQGERDHSGYLQRRSCRHRSMARHLRQRQNPRLERHIGNLRIYRSCGRHAEPQSLCCWGVLCRALPGRRLHRVLASRPSLCDQSGFRPRDVLHDARQTRI